MVKRRLTLKVYALALVITVAVFLIGVYVGQIANTEASENLFDEIKEFSKQSESFEIMFLLDDSPSFCPLYLEESSLLEERTLDIGSQLEYLEEVKGVYDVELKKQYFVLEAKSYLLARKTKELCNNNKTLILYFYSKDCDDCELQGEILDDVASEFSGEMRIYSFDGELDSSVVESFKKKYHISEYPFLVINDKTYKGLKEKEELLNILSGDG